MVFCKISVINLEEKINFVWCAFFPEKFGGGVRPASQNPYPIYDQTKNSKPNLWPDSHVKIRFQTCIIISSVVQTNFKLP